MGIQICIVLCTVFVSDKFINNFKKNPFKKISSLICTSDPDNKKQSCILILSLASSYSFPYCFSITLSFILLLILFIYFPPKLSFFMFFYHFPHPFIFSGWLSGWTVQKQYTAQYLDQIGGSMGKFLYSHLRNLCSDLLI